MNKERPHLFVLDGHEVRGVWDVLEWAPAFEAGFLSGASTVMRTTLVDHSVISTIFLGLDMGWSDKPLLFETALVSGEAIESEWLDGTKRLRHECEIVGRYSTWAEAEAGHIEWLERCVPPELIELTTKENERGET